MEDNRKELSNIAFSRDAATYDRSSRYAPLRRSYPAIVAEAVRVPFEAILDVGCGTGALLSLIRRENKTARLFGIDISESMIGVAKAKLGGDANLLVSESENIPFREGSFDLLTCTFSFHHHPNPATVLMEMRRVLSGNGRLILADPLIPAPMRQIFNLLIPWSKDGAVRYYSRRELLALVRSAGFRVSRWGKLNWHSYMLVADCV
jgi:ubiquinone/menaquinone biosynthesis C-methylase UbiE